MHNNPKPSRYSSTSKIVILAVVLLTFLFLTTTVFLRKSQLHQSKHGRDDDSENKPFEEKNAEELAGFGEGKNDQQQDKHEAAEIGALNEKTKYAASICDKVVPIDTIKHVLVYPHKFRGTREIGQDEASRVKKRLFFVGDSNALRMFRWTALFLHFAKFLTPPSSEYVTEHIVYNLNTGILHDRERISIDVVNNANRLSKIEFRRAAYTEDFNDVLNDITHNVVRTEKNFQAIVWISSGSWDILRPNKLKHDFTIDQLFDKLYHQTMKEAGGDAAAAAKNNKINEPQQQQHQEVDEAELGFTHDRMMQRWKTSCERVNEALIAAFGWGPDEVDEDHHIRRAMGNKGTYERVTWRFPGPPNCSASRFHPPRASKILEFACPFFSAPERSWWEGFLGQAREVVRPLDAKKKDDHGNDPIFEFTSERRDLPECDLKEDGVHPSHLCVAKEAAAYLMRVLS